MIDISQTARVCLVSAALFAAGCLGPSSGPAPCPTEPAPAIADSPSPQPGDAALGAELFATKCTRCHSSDVADRESRLFRSYPRLDCPDWLSKTSDAYLRRIISEGGEPFGKDPLMKPFAQELSEREIWNLVAYLRSLAR